MGVFCAWSGGSFLARRALAFPLLTEPLDDVDDADTLLVRKLRGALVLALTPHVLSIIVVLSEAHPDYREA